MFIVGVGLLLFILFATPVILFPPVSFVGSDTERRMACRRGTEIGIRLAVALVPAEAFRTLERLAAKDRQEQGPGCCPVRVPEPVAIFALDGAGSC